MITFCIPSKNNLRYLKHSIQSIRENSHYKNQIIVYVDADNDGTKKWLDQNGIKYLVNETNDPKGIAYGYNRCIEAAETELVCMFHADMYMAKGFDINLVKHIKDKVVVCATRIEPPLHPPGKEKIVKNFGMYPEDFLRDDFEKFCETESNNNLDNVTYGIFAPWCISRNELLEIGMHDEFFHSYQEDSDIFNRMILNGIKCIQSRDSFVYHFTCRGGQFQDGIERVTTDEKFHVMKNSAAKNYIRKWGSWVKNDEYQHPIIYPKYDIGFVIKNCKTENLSIFEYLSTNIYSELKEHEIKKYIENEQPNSQFNLLKKFKYINDKKLNDIIIEFDYNRLNNNSFQIITEISGIIKQTNDIGIFEIDVYNVIINELRECQNQLINSNSNFYKIQLK